VKWSHRYLEQTMQKNSNDVKNVVKCRHHQLDQSGQREKKILKLTGNFDAHIQAKKKVFCLQINPETHKAQRNKMLLAGLNLYINYSAI